MKTAFDKYELGKDIYISLHLDTIQFYFGGTIVQM